MIHTRWTPKGIIVAAALAACVAVIAAIGLVAPEPESNAALGPGWQCSRLAFVWTTCRRVKLAHQAAPVRLAGAPVCRRLRT
jgi:hypothetical protein